MIGRLGARSRGFPAASKPSSTLAAASSGTISLAGRSRLSLPRSTSCIAAVAVIALVMDAIQTTESSVMGAGLPRSRLPKAPSYSTSVSVAATATTPGIAFDSTAWRKIRSRFTRLDMVHLRVGARVAITGTHG